MFRFLDKHLYQRRVLEYNLEVFAYEKIGISRTTPLNQAKPTLVKAIKELEAIGLILPCDDKDRFKKVGKGVYTICFERGNLEAKVLMSPEETKLLEELKARNVTAKMASRLVRKYTSDLILQKIALHDWLLAKGDKRCSENPPGFLHDAIVNNYPLPKGFMQSKEEAKSNFKVIKGSKATDSFDTQLTRQIEVVKSEVEIAFENWWSKLEEDVQIQFESDAVEKAPTFQKTIYKNGLEVMSPSFLSIRKEILLTEYKRLNSGGE